MNIGANIRRIRMEKKMTQKELGEKIGGISQQQIARWENGDKNITLENLRKISAVFGVYISDLVGDWNQFSKEDIVEDLKSGNTSAISHKRAIELGGYPIDDLEKALINAYRRLNRTGQEKALDQITLLAKIPEYQREDE
jgi:transcriptional regulator with XRE-family HTH domain